MRAALRQRWRAWVGLAVLAGGLGGAVLAGVAAGVRTETAYPRFLVVARAFDVLFTNGGTTATNSNEQFEFAEVAALPQVEEAALIQYYFPSGDGGRPIGPSDLTPLASADGVFGRTLNAARPLEGRLPEGEHEVALTITAADTLLLEVGDALDLVLSGPGAISPDGPGPPEPERFVVVGVVAMPGGFPPLTGGLPPPVLLSSAYARAHPDAAEVIAVRLHGGSADVTAFQGALDQMAGGEQVLATYQGELTSVVQRSINVDATALQIVVALGVLVALLLVTQALIRQSVAEAEHHQILRALGVSRWGLGSAGLVRSTVIAVAAAVIACFTAVALSALSPVGLARRAEVDPGVDLDASVLAWGAAGVLVSVATIGSLAVAWATRHVLAPRVTHRVRPSVTVASLARAGLGVPALTGVRMALEPGRDRAGVRVALAAAATGIAMVVAVLTFTTSLGYLLRDPQLYGWGWDAQIGDAFAADLSEVADNLTGHPAVAEVATGTVARLQIDAIRVDTLAIEDLGGEIRPQVVDGRAPTAPDEILLGGRTMSDLGVGLGDTVSVGFGATSRQLRIVGRGVLPEFAGSARFGEGAAVTFAGMRRIVPDAERDVILLRLGPGADPRAVALSDPGAEAANLYLPTTPSDLADLERVDGSPSLVAGLLGMLAIGTLTHALVTSVRRKGRTLAVLKSVGCVRRQIFSTVVAQSTVLVGIALVVGLPLGVAAGRVGWQQFAAQLGVQPEVRVPFGATVVLVPVAVLLAVLIAVLPARAAARTRPAALLRDGRP